MRELLDKCALFRINLRGGSSTMSGKQVEDHNTLDTKHHMAPTFLPSSSHRYWFCPSISSLDT